MQCEEFLGLYDLLLDCDSGRGELGPSTLTALRRHRDECPRCRAEVEQQEEVAALLRALPVLEAPAVPAARVRRLGPWRPLWMALLSSAAAAVVVTCLFVWVAGTNKRRFPPGACVEAKRQGRWEAVSRWTPSTGVLLRTTTRNVRFALSPNVAVELDAQSRFAITGAGRVELERGRMTAWVRQGVPFAVSTPLAQATVTGTVFTVSVEHHDSARSENSHDRKESPMNSSLKTVPIAAFVSVFVSLGTVTVYNSFGSVDVEANEEARVAKDMPPELVRVPDTLRELQEELVATRKAVQELTSQTSQKTETLESRISGLEEKTASLAPSAEKETGKEAATQDPEKLLEEAEKIFVSLKDSGVSAYASPKLTELAEKIRELGEEGREFVLRELTSEDGDGRFLAAAVAEKLKDPELIDVLETSALEDENFLVRRMSSHALAFMDHEAAGDALLNIINKETRDGGVRINAWYGLATLGRPEAIPTFEKLLNEAGGDIPPDFVVDTALKISDPKLLPSLRLAYDKKNVSKAMKVRILRTLGNAESGEYRSFLRQLSLDENAEADLRKTATEALGGN